MRFIAIGDNCIDYYVKTKKGYAGGNSVNFAVYIKQLGGESAYIGAVGNDDNGKILIDALNKEQVDISHLHVLEGKTAVTEVEIVDSDRKLSNFNSGVTENFTLTNQDIEYIKSYDYLHTAVWGKMEDYLRKLKNSIIICYDFSNKLTLPNINDILKSIDYAFFSYDEDNEYIRDYLIQAQKQGLVCSIATLGENGSLAYDGQDFYNQGINKVKVVDTIGAGDSFIAGFMFAVSKGMGIQECLKKGSERAQKTIGYYGSF